MNSVKLNVRSQGQDGQEEKDLIIDATLSSSILDIKKEIQSKHRVKPEPVDQRLVYGGKMLKNDSILASCLRLDHVLSDDEAQVFVIHLICRNIKKIASEINHDAPNTSLPVQSPTISSTQSYPSALNNPADHDSASSSHNNTSNHFYYPYYPDQYPNPSLMMQFGSGNVGHGEMGTSQLGNYQDHHQQVMWMHHQHMYQQSMAAFHHHQMMLNQHNMQHSQPNLSSQDWSSHGGQVPQPISDPLQQPAQQNSQEGTPSGSDNGRVRRDLSEYLFFFSRVLLLSFFVFLHSSMVRCLLVVTIAVFVYFWNNGILGRLLERLGYGGGSVDVNQENRNQSENDILDNGNAESRPSQGSVIESSSRRHGSVNHAMDSSDENDVSSDASSTVGDEGDMTPSVAETISSSVRRRSTPANESPRRILRSTGSFITSFFASVLPDPQRMGM